MAAETFGSTTMLTKNLTGNTGMLLHTWDQNDNLASVLLIVKM